LTVVKTTATAAATIILFMFFIFFFSGCGGFRRQFLLFSAFAAVFTITTFGNTPRRRKSLKEFPEEIKPLLKLR